MSDTLTQHLNEHLRDAMLGFYLNSVLPEDKAVADTVKSVDDVYAYWLLDPQVSHTVPTTRVASAIASLQQYITGIYLGLEPGYDEQGMSADEQTQWRDQLLSYSLWRAHQQLQHYPATYLSPTLRHDKSDNFRQLENQLNQFRIEPAPLQAAAHSYLSRFEALANIKTLNGYIDGDKDSFASSTYYFTGKSSSDNTYYWRTLEMATSAAATPTAWSAWQKIPLSIGDNVPEQTIRPVVFNGRLFVVWAQCINPTSSRDITPIGRGDVESKKDYQQRLETRIKTTYLQFRLYFSYKKLDDSWHVPQACIQEYSLAQGLDDLSAEDLMSATASIAVLDSKSQPPALFLGLSAQPNHQTASSHNGLHRHFFHAVRLDQHFNVHWLETLGSTRRMFSWHKESELAGRYLALFGHHNRSRFQFRAPETVQVAVQSLTNGTPHATTNGWNYGGSQQYIRSLSANTDIKFNRTTSVLEVTTRLDKRFEPHRTVRFRKADALVNLTIILSSSGPAQDDTLALGPTSEIFLEGAKLVTFSNVRIDLTLKCNETGVSYAQFIKDEKNQAATFTLPQIGKDEENPKSTTFNLSAKRIRQEAFDYFFNTQDATYTVTLAFFNIQGKSETHAYDLELDKVQVQQKQRLYKPVLMYPKQANTVLPESPHRNNTVLIGLADASRRTLRDTFTELSKTHTLESQIELSPQTLQPYDEDLAKTPASTLTLIHGVLLLESDVHYPDPIILGYGLKTATFTLPPDNSAPIIPLAPFIQRLATPPYGAAEFIDFNGSAIESLDTPENKRPPIRTNTCVAGLLAKTAGTGLHELFALAPDAWREPPLPGEEKPSPLDFQGPHGTYYWELFLYLPWLLAQRLNQEQQYAEAETWIRYVFDPVHPSDVWRLPALLASTPQGHRASSLSHPLAKSSAVHFRQALYLLYVDILLNRGDAAYRQLTRDSLAEAKLWYIRAKGLLGPRPPLNPVDPWATTTLDKLQNPSTLDSKAVPANTSRLCRSLSPDLLLRWDKIESRLHNLRHHLDLTGKPLSLPLYTATLSPQTLLAAYQQGSAGVSLRPSLRTAQAAHYRFQVLLGHALQAVDNLIQLGTTLLSLFERKEQAQYLETQQQQAWDLARLAVEQQAQAVQFDARNKEALLAGRSIVQARVAFFEQQLKRGISPAEAQATQEYQDSARWDTAAAVAQAGAGLAMLIPNIFGTSNGGVRYEGAFHALHAASQGIANEKRANAAHLDRADLFARRATEWAHTLEQARLELAQVDAQLQAYTEQEAHTRLQLGLAQASFTQARTLYDQLGKRFTNAQLYQWLNGQLSTFYYQAYDSTLSLCLAAEACWQEERAQWDKHFIQTQPWTHQYRGLSAGEALKHNLLSMSSAYLTHNERLLEITKTVSLRHLHSKDPVATRDKPWATLKADLVKTGTMTFELTLKLFDDDYPGHYLRRIKHLSVSLPATLGPYEDIKAILTQTTNTTHLTPAAKHTEAAVKKDLRAKQQIALSSGLNDSGLFTLNFDSDERYLPFEYTGAISAWQLTFPNHTRQNALLESLTDIIVHLRYTAKNTGGQR
ncbi:neuraminidase-like domain-containing protein [Pseudomonas lactis]|uniref:Tc toxin subunit A-related protein n=1 Tax=Pseudomonas lactis TaxID=1615674 RepID=UPI0014745436|nr:neuraminidase-like domain-containing protein [Pseudomonas lactis]NNA48811.1 phage tail tape measure protein [Pseudomonas lactis]